MNLERSDIRPNTSDGVAAEGAPLQLGWVVSQVDGDGCLPMEGVIVDVWHCDALGVYSGVQGSAGTDFLRGFQRTDASGGATFTTVYPGWYQGRAVHIHFKIRTDPDAEAGFEFTSQLFFDDALSQQVYASGVYASKGPPDQPNASDGIFNQSGGADAPGCDPGRRHLQDHVRDRRPAGLSRPASRACSARRSTAAKRAPQPRTRDHGADDGADGQAAEEVGRGPLVLVLHARRSAVGPSTATTETSPIPTHATMDAPSRW